MKRLALFLIILVALALLYFGLRKSENQSFLPTPKISELAPGDSQDEPLATIAAENLEVPWGIAFLPASPASGPDGGFLVTERVGRVRLIDKNFNLLAEPVLTLSVVQRIQGEGGLHGIVLHPDFEKNKFVYIYYTYESSNGQTLNRVERYILENNKLVQNKAIIDRIPGSLFHDGGRIKFGPDNNLYITTGDAQNPELAQDTNSLAGKILRVTDEGDIPSDNPFGNAVYSYGHRNPQGIAWDEENNLWSTEHGRSGALSGLDEVNLIEKGKNYGWPEIQGDEERNGMEKPILHSGTSDTWAPACAVILENRLFFSGLRGEALYETVTENKQTSGLKEHFKNEYGRIRECILGPDGMLYITTSNRDGRGDVRDGDDKILRVNPKKLL
jgi:glucose/arabinose dehydrogenase